MYKAPVRLISASDGGALNVRCCFPPTAPPSGLCILTLHYAVLMMRRSFRILAFFPSLAFGVPKNVSVDDQFPDPMTGNSIQYLGGTGGAVATGNWQIGQDCSPACTADLDISKVFNGTYRYAEANIDAGAVQAASLSFSGEMG